MKALSTLAMALLQAAPPDIPTNSWVCTFSSQHRCTVGKACISQPVAFQGVVMQLDGYYSHCTQGQSCQAHRARYFTASGDLVGQVDDTAASIRVRPDGGAIETIVGADYALVAYGKCKAMVSPPVIVPIQ